MKLKYVMREDTENKRWLIFEQYPVNPAKTSYYHIRTYEFDNKKEFIEYGLMLLLENI